MKITNYENPFPFITIENTFTPDELNFFIIVKNSILQKKNAL